MAAKRLNVKFVIILGASILFAALLALGALYIQSNRQVEQCYQQGVEAFGKGDMAEARVNLGHVVEKLHDDNARIDATIKLALAYIALLDQPNKSHQDIQVCLAVLLKALELDPTELGQNRVKFKESVAQCNLLLGKPGAAADMYVELGKEFVDEPQYLLHAAECFAKNKDSRAADTLSTLVSRHVEYIPGWIAYAQYYQDNDQLDLAMQTLNSMVDNNSDSAQAFAQRAIFLYEHPEMEGMALAEESALNAIRLDENNLDALLAATKMSIYLKHFDEAHDYLSKAKQIAKTLADQKRDQRIVDFGIQLADAEGKPESALEILQDDVAEDPLNITKRLQLFQRLIVLDKMEDAQKEIDNLRQIHQIPIEYLGFFEATIEIREEKWSSAVKKLEAARAFMGQQPEMLAYIDRQRALCYGKLGQLDKQFEAFQKAILFANEAELVPFYLAYVHALHSAGRIPQMEEVLGELRDKIGDSKFMEYHELRTLYFALLQQKESMKPKDEQNWQAIEKQMSAHNMDTNNPEGILLSVRMLVKQDKIAEAKDLLRRAVTEHPDTIAFVSYLALLEAQEKNFKEALLLINTELLKKENNPGLLVTKVRILSQMDPEGDTSLADVKKELKEIEELAYSMPENVKLTLLKQIAMAWLQFEDLEEADRLYTMVIQFDPENIGIKIQLFDLARKSNNEQKMSAQMERIRKDVGTSSPEYRYCQATKAIWEYSQKPDSPEKLRAAKEHLSIAGQLRPEWVYIPRAQAEIAILEKDYNSAISYLYRVDEIGTLTTQQLNLLIRLLYKEGRDDEVQQLVARKREANLAVDAAMMSVEALVNSGKGDEAVSRGSKIIDPNNPKDYLWIGHIALKAKDYRKAEDAFLKVTEIAPENPNGWLSLLQVRKIQAIDVPQEEFIAKVRESVPEEKLPLCLAKAYQLFGDAKEAEKTFKQAVSLDPENLEVLFSISQFYMCTTHPELAIPYLKKMSSEITADRRLNSDAKSQQLAWTRRSLAQVYSGIPNFDLQNQGLQLIEENLTRQPDSLEDMKIKAVLLTARHNPEDNQRAIEIFENIPVLGNRDLFILAKLYYEQSFSPDAAAMKEKYRSIMTDLITGNESNLEYLRTYLDMMFSQNEAAENISNFLDRYESLAGENDPVVLLYRIKYLAITSKPAEVQNYLLEHFPKEIFETNIETVREYTYELEKLNLTEAASKIWTELAAVHPDYMKDFMLFIARTKGFTDAFAYLQANQEKINAKQQLNLIASACRHSKKTVTRAEFKQVLEYVRVLFRDEPEALELKMLEARVLEFQGKYDDAIAVYNSLLEKPFTAPQLAAVENSLAYLLALTGKDVDRAAALIDRATNEFGYDPNLRDSRAVVYMRSEERSKTDKALEDLKYIAVVQNNAVSQFHFAVMYWKRNNASAAKIAFETAKRMDPFLFQNLPSLEVPGFTELTNNLE